MPITSTGQRATAERHQPLHLIVSLLVAACSTSDATGPQAEPDPEPLPAVDLVEGTVIGREALPGGNTADGGQGERLAGIGCIDQIDSHYHAHVSLFVEGERIAIPLAIGIVDPVVEDGFVENGGCFYWMHTHDRTGLVHLEPPVADDYTLGQLFAVWGRPLSETNVAGFIGTVSVFVDGERYSDDPSGIVFESGRHISLQIGHPLAPPPMYDFQP